MTDEEWWVARVPLLDKLIDPTRFPVATRVGTSQGRNIKVPKPGICLHIRAGRHSGGNR